MRSLHLPVLRDRVVALLGVGPGGMWLDGTVGLGGHAEALLEASAPDGVVVGVDRDPTALAEAARRLSRFGDRFVPRRGRFGDLARVAGDRAPYDGLLLDLGVSSPQLDRPERGFSFQHDGPLDMRMDPDQPLTAAALLDQLDETGLVEILRRYGEEPRARRIARAILDGRPWTRTGALAECVARASGYRGGRTHPATRTFQALRIAVNDELGELERVLDAVLSPGDGPPLVRPGGRFAVITFHSLEDRIVKRRFREAAGIGTPRDAFGHPVTPPLVRLLTRKAIAGSDADPANPRARSAHLRAVEFLPARSPQHS